MNLYTYHIDSNGDVSRWEGISPELEEEGFAGMVSYLQDDLLQLVPRIDFIPAGGVWIVPPDVGDYEKIGRILGQIERGELISGD